MASHRVSLGQFYTPSAVTDFMVSLAVADPRRARVLEAGCGPGAFLDSLRRAGFSRIEAHELDPANAAAVRARLGDQVELVEGDFLQAPRRADRDLVIGNPPYVSHNNIPAATRQHLQHDPFWARYYNGEWDLLYGFLIASAERLVAGGQLLQIIPTNWFYSTYAASLRDYLTRCGHVERIIAFGEARLFADCAPNAIILDWRKRPSTAPIEVASFSGRSSDAEQIIASLRRALDGHEEPEWNCFRTDQPRGQEPWLLAAPSEVRFVRDLEEACDGQTLADHARVGVGLVSGADRVFALQDRTQIPDDLVISLVKAASCQPFALGETVPYLWPQDVASAAELQRRSPAAFRQLSRQREALEARYLSTGRRWFDWATVRNLELQQTPRGVWKLFLPCRDRGAPLRVAASDQGECASGDALVIVPDSIDPLYLLAWLNSASVGRWYQARGARSGARWIYSPAFVGAIPVPCPEPPDAPDADLIAREARRAARGRSFSPRDIDAAFARILARRDAYSGRS